MSARIVTRLAGADKPSGIQQHRLPAFFSQQLDAVLWLEENTHDPLVRSFAGIARRRLEALIPPSGPVP